MRAQVIAVDPGRVFAVRTDGGITVMEIQDGHDIHVDEFVVGDFQSHGTVTLHNETQDTDLNVFIDAIHCTAEAVLQTYGLKCPRQ